MRGRRRVDAQPAALDPVGAHVAVAAGEAIDAVLLALGQEHQLHGLAVVAMGNVAQRAAGWTQRTSSQAVCASESALLAALAAAAPADERRRIPRIPPAPGPANPCKAGGRARTEYWAWAEPPIDCTPLDCNRHRSPLSRALPRPSALRPSASGSPALGGKPSDRVLGLMPMARGDAGAQNRLNSSRGIATRAAAMAATAAGRQCPRNAPEHAKQAAETSRWAF